MTTVTNIKMLFQCAILFSASAIVWGQDPQTKPPSDSQSQKYKEFPLSYPLNAVSFNPYYYGFYQTGSGSQMTPIPRPNFYYNLPNPSIPIYRNPTALPSTYIPTTWSQYPYTNADSLFTNKNLGLSLPPLKSNVSTAHNETHEVLFKSKKPIVITKPDLTITIVPPKADVNSEKTKPEDLLKPSENASNSSNPKLSEGTRKMIKNLLKLGTQHFKMIEENDEKNKQNSELVIQPRQARSNIYPLPKAVYGEANEPSTFYDRTKIFTELGRF